MTLEQAYAECRSIARREARNFYYSFVALPGAKRDAICAVYAFMRRADDISDDDRLPVSERRRQLCDWRAEWDSARAGEATADPVFLALGDASHRFRIPAALLGELIDGTAMDLEQGDGPRPGLSFETWEELTRYCYLVASVVGLVCIRIFGYSDPAAEALAEQTGLAFQLTNILRDIGEDAARGRVYVPLELLRRHGLSRQDFLGAVERRELALLRPVLAELGERAEDCYRAARSLLPLIDRDSRPALKVLVGIYQRLLGRIRAAGFDVLAARVRVPAAEKMILLAAGLGEIALYRLAAPLRR